MTASLRLPSADGRLLDHEFRAPVDWPRPAGPLRSRVAFAAAHVVADPLADNTPGTAATLDWDATLAFRRHLWSYGLGVAEAMDTAQRGMGLDWEATHTLIRRTAGEAKACGGRVAAGAGTDHAPVDVDGLDRVVQAYEEQVTAVEDAGAQVVLMASRQLARVGNGPEDYRKVYDRLLAQTREPVILHWLGPMFDPALAGYWGTDDVGAATEVVLDLVRDHARAVDGVKVSLLDADHERALRRGLPPGVRLYTGDDFHYQDLIRGDGEHTSDALLGIFAAIAPAASAAVQALDDGDVRRYDNVLAPTVPLARHLFGAPTFNYKTGIAFLAWLAGHQPGFTMVGGLSAARSVPHLVEAFRLAETAGLLPDPDLAATRMRCYLNVAGVQQ